MQSRLKHFLILTAAAACYVAGICFANALLGAASDVFADTRNSSKSSAAANASSKAPASNVSALPASAPTLRASDEDAGNSASSGLKDQIGFGSNQGDSKAPIFIKSDKLDLDSKGRVFTYRGRVEVVKDDLVITSDEMVGTYDEQNKIQKMVCTENVVITRGDRVRATANRAVYRVADATIELTEGPEVIQHGNALAADRIIMYVDEDRSEAEGNVQVKVVKTEQASSFSSKGKAPAK